MMFLLKFMYVLHYFFGLRFVMFLQYFLWIDMNALHEKETNN